MSGFLRAFRARPRTVALFVIVAVLALTLPGDWSLSTRLLTAWAVGALVYLILVAWMAYRSDVLDMRRRAAVEDESAIAILVLTTVAAMASLAAIGFEFANLSGVPATARGLHLALAGVTLLCSWLLMHVTFALHYAHEYYDDDGERGLNFPEAHGDGDTIFEPDYWDFLYFSVNLGAAAQTSDVMIVSRQIRRIVLGHTILSFLFNTTVLALGVNMAASIVAGP
ncbi:DUF1345 domain-containing protein [Chelatococcus sp. GCM10030263]|uniref:DUF1345 domain-containing protein n=1 Tax=Chelatococcus sp. GCM10030263 TaxID=3273387 RepID=UPI0036090A2D